MRNETGYHFDEEGSQRIVEETKQAFNLTLARIGTMLSTGNANKNCLEPKTAYSFTIEPVNAVFFEVTTAFKPSPLVIRIVNDTDGCGACLAKG